MAKRDKKVDKLPTEPYKGVRDFYPEELSLLNYIFATWRGVVERFGYEEYHASILEPSELYKAKGAENTEIVKEQTYTFIDRGGREVTLRPEMTPTIARMVAAKRREMGFPLRWYSIPNVFRYERPQRGRLREHWQLNLDIFGSKSPSADAEIIAVGYELMKAFGAAEEDFTIKLGSRNFLDSVIETLDLSQEHAHRLRLILDRKNKIPHEEFEKEIAVLGVAIETLSPERPPPDVAEVLGILSSMGVGNAVFDPSIVRGFDYYNGVVFEFFDTHPENNRAMFGGGRYDGLTSLFDNENLPAVGMAAGDVTFRDFLAVRGFLPEYTPKTRVYIAVAGPEFVRAATHLAADLRKENVHAAIDFGEKRLGEQIKVASKHKIPYLIVVGEDEVASETYAVRDLATGQEKTLSRAELSNFFLNL